jgi:hypothetical protein
MAPVPDHRSTDKLDWSDARLWLVLGLGVIFLLLGVLFIFAPDVGALLFGIEAANDARILAYIAAIGIRDVALGLMIVVLGLHSRRATALLLAVAALIPVGDVILVASFGGLGSVPSLLLHAVSGGALGTLSLLLFRSHPQQRL